jgi:hypothetical protein
MRTRFELLWIRVQRAWLESELEYLEQQIERPMVSAREHRQE